VYPSQKLVVIKDFIQRAGFAGGNLGSGACQKSIQTSRLQVCLDPLVPVCPQLIRNLMEQRPPLVDGEAVDGFGDLFDGAHGHL
jgi:hypothetical protein